MECIESIRSLILAPIKAKFGVHIRQPILANHWRHSDRNQCGRNFRGTAASADSSPSGGSPRIPCLLPRLTASVRGRPREVFKFGYPEVAPAGYALSQSTPCSAPQPPTPPDRHPLLQINAALSILIPFLCCKLRLDAKMPEKQCTEADVENAINAVREGLAIKKAARDHGVPRSTLQSRLQGAQPIRQAQEPFQRLSPTQEKGLADWILLQASLGLPPTHAEIRFFAQEILRISGDRQPLGKRWVQHFLARHPEIATARGRRIESARAKGATTEVIQSGGNIY